MLLESSQKIVFTAQESDVAGVVELTALFDVEDDVIDGSETMIDAIEDGGIQEDCCIQTELGTELVPLEFDSPEELPERIADAFQRVFDQEGTDDEERFADLVVKEVWGNDVDLADIDEQNASDLGDIESWRLDSIDVNLAEE